MNFKQLFDDDRAVSPVIGVILMVAITVILAAVIGTFVLGLGDQVQNTTPQASFGFNQDTETISDYAGPSNAEGSTDVTSVTVTHETGDTIAASDIKVTVDGKTAYGVTDSDGENNNVTALWQSGDISAGSSVTIVAATNDGVNVGNSLIYDHTGSGAIDIYNGSTGTVASSGVGLSSGETIRVIYDNPNSDSSSTLAKREIQ